MGKLQFNRGTTEVPTLQPGEPYFNNEDKLFIGKADGSGNKEIGASETGATIRTKLQALTGDARLDASAIKNLPEGGVGSQTVEIVEWAFGAEKPSVDCDDQVGSFVEGKRHKVSLATTEDESIVATIEVINWIEQMIPAEVAAMFTNVTAMAQAPDGGVVIAHGDGISKLTATYQKDPLFNEAPYEARCLIIDPEGYIWAGGQNAPYLIKLNPDGTEFEGFVFEAFREVNCLCFSSYNSIVYAGTNGGEGAAIVAFNLDGSYWSEFQAPLLGDAVFSIVENYNNGYLYAGGAFTERIIQFQSTGETWSQKYYGLNGSVTALAFDGTNIYIGGLFTQKLIKINAMDAILQPFADYSTSNITSINQILDNGSGLIVAAHKTGNNLMYIDYTGQPLPLEANITLPVRAVSYCSDGFLVAGNFLERLVVIGWDGSILSYSKNRMENLENRVYDIENRQGVHIVRENDFENGNFNVYDVGTYVFLSVPEAAQVTIAVESAVPSTVKLVNAIDANIADYTLIPINASFVNGNASGNLVPGAQFEVLVVGQQLFVLTNTLQQV